MRKLFSLSPLMGACLWCMSCWNATVTISKADTQVDIPVDTIGKAAHGADDEPTIDAESSRDWYLHHYDCKLDIANFPKVIEAFCKLGIEVKNGIVDLSYATQYFSHEAESGEGPCLRGKQVTCNDIIFDILDQAKKNNNFSSDVHEKINRPLSQDYTECCHVAARTDFGDRDSVCSDTDLCGRSVHHSHQLDGAHACAGRQDNSRQDNNGCEDIH